MPRTCAFDKHHICGEYEQTKFGKKRIWNDFCIGFIQNAIDVAKFAKSKPLEIKMERIPF